MAFISGAYNAVYNSLHLGSVENGFEMVWRRHGELINTDVMGDGFHDEVYRGVTLTVAFTLSEWNAAGAQAAFWPMNSTFGNVGSMGVLSSTLAKALVLTACDSATPTTITFTKALLSRDFDVRALFANRHRKVPLEMTVFPQVAGSAGGANCYTHSLFTTS